MTIQPPSGAEDLAAQAEALRREREEFQAEQAAALAARADRDLAEAEATAAADADTYHVDADGNPILDPDGKPYRRGEWETDDNGALILDDAGSPYPLWKHDTVEHKGHTFQIRRAEPAAVNAFTMMSTSSLPAATQMRMYRQFVDRHMSLMSQAKMFDLMLDGEFDMDDYKEMFKLIATQDTARPTGPSKH